MRQLREEQIVRAACDLVLRDGCHEARVEDVAAACGVAKGTCYQHFETRPALIAAAVRRLDAAMAARLASPPRSLRTPRQVFDWAVLQVIDAKLLTLAQRDRPETRRVANPKDLHGKAWPCCLRFMSCPHGDAARSLNELHHWTRRLKTPSRTPTYVCLALLLALPIAYFGNSSRRANSRTVRSTARHLLARLFS